MHFRRYTSYLVAVVFATALAVSTFELFPHRRTAVPDGQVLPPHRVEKIDRHGMAKAGNAPPPDPVIVDGIRIPYNPYKPSDGPYPVLVAGERIWIDVSIDQQLVYLFHGSRRLYTMPTSSGMESVPGDASPLGVYHIQAKRGLWFYVAQYHEGAKYWLSWLGNGIYLFHSVPMDRSGNVVAANAALLLHEASHGCFHLTIPDAEWMYEHVPYGTTVVVERPAPLLDRDSIVEPTPPQLEAIVATAGFRSHRRMVIAAAHSPQGHAPVSPLSGRSL